MFYIDNSLSLSAKLPLFFLRLFVNLQIAVALTPEGDIIIITDDGNLTPEEFLLLHSLPSLEQFEKELRAILEEGATE